MAFILPLIPVTVLTHVLEPYSQMNYENTFENFIFRSIVSKYVKSDRQLLSERRSLHNVRTVRGNQKFKEKKMQ